MILKVVIEVFSGVIQSFSEHTFILLSVHRISSCLLCTRLGFTSFLSGFMQYACIYRRVLIRKPFKARRSVYIVSSSTSRGGNCVFVLCAIFFAKLVHNIIQRNYFRWNGFKSLFSGRRRACPTFLCLFTDISIKRSLVAVVKRDSITKAPAYVYAKTFFLLLDGMRFLWM